MCIRDRANSDTEEDQRHKLLVRDALLEEYSELLGRAESAEAAERFAHFLLEDIRRTAEKTLREADDEHPVEVSLTEMYFDTRTYEDGITLPAGEYADVYKRQLQDGFHCQQPASRRDRTS